MYRRVKTRQELMMNEDIDHKEFVRAKRKNIPNHWDDIYAKPTKNWKKKRKTQYYNGGRGEKHSVRVGYKYYNLYYIEEYMKNHNIPYAIQKHYKTKVVEHKITTKSVLQKTDGGLYIDSRGIQRRLFKYRYIDVPLEEPIVKKYKMRRYDGFTITWWSDKDIGIDFILKRYYVM